MGDQKPPNLVKKSEFATLAGVSKPAISRGIKSGGVVVTDGMIDLNHPQNQKYLHGKSSHQQTTKRIIEQQKKNPRLRSENLNNAEIVDAREKKEAIQNQILAVKLQKDKIDYYERIKRSVPSAIMLRAFGRVGAVLDENMKAFDERHGDELYNFALSGASEREFCEKLAKNIDKTVKGVIRAVKKEIAALDMPEEA